MNDTNKLAQRQSAQQEMTAWFFDDYLRRWVNAGAGRSEDESNFISSYWGHPLHVCTDAVNEYKMGEADVVNFLDTMHARLKRSGYSHTAVPDRRIRALSANGGFIEVIWSRRRADESEIERIAAHFEVCHTGDSWRVVSIQSTHTTAKTLEETWPEAILEPL